MTAAHTPTRHCFFVVARNQRTGWHTRAKVSREVVGGLISSRVTITRRAYEATRKRVSCRPSDVLEFDAVTPAILEGK